jgi:hypothetical protein
VVQQQGAWGLFAPGWLHVVAAVLLLLCLHVAAQCGRHGSHLLLMLLLVEGRCTRATQQQGSAKLTQH